MNSRGFDLMLKPGRNDAPFSHSPKSPYFSH
jgi:hypothetical protein